MGGVPLNPESSKAEAAAGQSHGLLALFCDMEEKWREEFRAWLAEDMFPARLKAGLFACASYDAVADIERGTQSTVPEFLTLYETATVADLYGEAYQSLRRDRDERDTAIHERMMGLERYTLASAGPSPAPGGELAPVVYVDRFDLRPDDIGAFNAWFVNEYLSWCAKLRGLVRVRRYLSMEGAPRHFILHEFEDRSFYEDAVWKALRNSKEWVMAGNTYGAPGLYERAVKAP